MRQLPAASCGSEANLLKMLKQRRVVKSAGNDMPASKESSLLRSASETSVGRHPRSAGAPRQRVSAGFPRLPAAGGVQTAFSPPLGVSTAFLVSCLVDYRPTEDAPVERRTTRAIAATLRRRRQEEGEEAVPGAQELVDREETHPLTGGPSAGPSSTYVAHAWDADFSDLVDCLVNDARSDFDRRYSLDIFGAEHLPPAADSPSSGSAPGRKASVAAAGDDPVTAVQAHVTGAKEVLLVLDAEAKCLSRLWVLFEAMMALPAGKLRIRNSDPKGYGNSEADVLKWEARIDAIDWNLAETTRKSDEKRLHAFAERVWETHGTGTERLLAQLKVLLRREAYGHVLIGAVEAGDRKAVEAALDRGASLQQRDADGNTLEDLAVFCKHQDIEEMLFERRMRGMAHKPLSMFFAADELVANSGDADPDVLAPFMTEFIDGFDGCGSDAASEDADWRLLANLEHLSNQSTATHTPGSSQRDWRTPSGSGGYSS
eukprot:gb/GFBE01006903.1/.p1 GENE.gb/GFBE01006903.1/~~gb/GFBE01006903.1/.p1  ORF type:complete len:487 (+),score=73.18 gb/GFBE01006903.1/:1-1461(+)